MIYLFALRFVIFISNALIMFMYSFIIMFLYSGGGGGEIRSIYVSLLWVTVIEPYVIVTIPTRAQLLMAGGMQVIVRLGTFSYSSYGLSDYGLCK